MRVRVVLPHHLRNLARVGREIELELDGEATLGAVLDALERRHPVLRGAIRDARSGARRAFVRFFACERDLSHEPASFVLPEPVATGREPLLIVGAMAGG